MKTLGRVHKDTGPASTRQFSAKCVKVKSIYTKGKEKSPVLSPIAVTNSPSHNTPEDHWFKPDGLTFQFLDISGLSPESKLLTTKLHDDKLNARHLKKNPSQVSYSECNTEKAHKPRARNWPFSMLFAIEQDAATRLTKDTFSFSDCSPGRDPLLCSKGKNSSV